MNPASAAAASGALSHSKLGVYIMFGSPGGRNIIEQGPRVITAFDPHKIPSVLQLVRAYKQLHPAGRAVMHVYDGTQDRHYTRSDDPAVAAADFWQHALAPAVTALPAADRRLFDYLAGPNEFSATPPLLSAADAVWVGRFWIAIGELISQAGFRPLVGELPVGSLDIGRLDELLPPLVPALQHIEALGGAWSYHGYTILYSTSVGVEIWYALRYRQFYTYLSRNFPTLASMPMILTEIGVDEHGDPAESGWKARGDAATYQRWLRWFDNEVQQDPYILGTTIFQIGDAYWSSFNIEDIAGWLADYLQQAVATPAGTATAAPTVAATPTATGTPLPTPTATESVPTSTPMSPPVPTSTPTREPEHQRAFVPLVQGRAADPRDIPQARSRRRRP